jgi:hypothetical protein
MTQQVMDKLGYEHGLILHHAERHRQPPRIAARIIVYGTLLTLLAAPGLGSPDRKPFIAEVLRDRNALYRVLGDGSVEMPHAENVNKTDQTVHSGDSDRGPEAHRRYALLIEGPCRAVLLVPLRIAAPARARAEMELEVTRRFRRSAGRPQQSSFFAPAKPRARRRPQMNTVALAAGTGCRTERARRHLLPLRRGAGTVARQPARR